MKTSYKVRGRVTLTVDHTKVYHLGSLFVEARLEEAYEYHCEIMREQLERGSIDGSWDVTVVTTPRGRSTADSCFYRLSYSVGSGYV